MVLPPEGTNRFYRVWFPLLRYVNEQRHLVPALPASPGDAAVSTDDALKVRDALWGDDSLREQFIADNPANLPVPDLELVASWRYRVAGKFFIDRHLKKHTIFLSETTPVRAYGVLGLISPLEDVVGPYLPVLAEAVLLPFEGRIIYDSLIMPYAADLTRYLRHA
jgi:hypothetical protein